MIAYPIKNLLKNKFQLEFIALTSSIFMTFSAFSQLRQINTNTSETLIDLSIVAKKLLVSGTQTFMASSTNECQTLNFIAKPNTTSFYNRLQRLDTNNLFLFSYSSNQALIYHSNNCGNNWIQKYNSGGGFNCQFSFNDTLTGYLSVGSAMYKTINGGITLSQIYPPYQLSIMILKSYKDSIVGMMGINTSLSGISLSKNKGINWTQEWGMWNIPSDMFFLSKDTVMALGSHGDLLITKNGGNTWDASLYVPTYSTQAVRFKNSNEGYVVGSDNQNNGTIAKTTDLGKTWSVFNTGVQTTLYNIAFLNDSIAFLSGSNGVLLRWNYKQTIFTGINNSSEVNNIYSIYPNPTTKKLNFSYNRNLKTNFDLSITNLLGQVIFTQYNFKLEDEMDIRFLPEGIYCLKIENESGQRLFKFIKE